MSRDLSDEEKKLLRTLVGERPPFAVEFEKQLEGCLANEVEDGGLELKPVRGNRIKTHDTVLGSGSIYDVDGVPVIFDLLQYDGYIAKLLIEKADSSQIKSVLDYQQVMALGYGRGITLER